MRPPEGIHISARGIAREIIAQPCSECRESIVEYLNSYSSCFFIPFGRDGHAVSFWPILNSKRYSVLPYNLVGSYKIGR